MENKWKVETMKVTYLIYLSLICLSSFASVCDTTEVILPELELKNDSSKLLYILNNIASYKVRYCVDTPSFQEVHILITNEKYKHALKGKRMVHLRGTANLSEELKFSLGYVHINGHYFFIYNGSGVEIDEFGNIFTATNINKVFKTSTYIGAEGVWLEDDSIECIFCQLYYKDGKFFFYEDDNGNFKIECPSGYPACYNNAGPLNLFMHDSIPH